MKKPKVFLAHASEDKERVNIIKSFLEKDGIECWIDSDKMQPGDSILQEIDKGLNNTDFVIFFISSASKKSSWVKHEVLSSLATQINNQKVKVIPVILENIDIPNIFNDIVCADLSDQNSKEGATILARTIHSHFETINIIIDNDSLTTEDIARDMTILNRCSIKNGFHWFILSGASSAGKDVLAYLLDQKLSMRYNLEMAIKYTTRQRRNSEPSNIISLDENKFIEMKNAGKIIFSYKKRNHFYGFDATQFCRAIEFGYPLVSIFTHLSHVPTITKNMYDNSYPTTAIFIDVPRKHLLRRVVFRNFSIGELRDRIRSIDRDLTQIKQRKTLKEEYIFLKNSDKVAIDDSAKKLCDIVISKLTDT